MPKHSAILWRPCSSCSRCALDHPLGRALQAFAEDLWRMRCRAAQSGTTARSRCASAIDQLPAWAACLAASRARDCWQHGCTSQTLRLCVASRPVCANAVGCENDLWVRACLLVAIRTLMCVVCSGVSRGKIAEGVTVSCSRVPWRLPGHTNVPQVSCKSKSCFSIVHMSWYYPCVGVETMGIM